MADPVERAGTYALVYLAVVQHWNVVCPDDKRSEACPRRRGWRRGDVARALNQGTIPAGLHHRSPLLEISCERLASEVRYTERHLEERRAMQLRIQYENEIQQLTETKAAQEARILMLEPML